MEAARAEGLEVGVLDMATASLVGGGSGTGIDQVEDEGRGGPDSATSVAGADEEVGATIVAAEGREAACLTNSKAVCTKASEEVYRSASSKGSTLTVLTLSFCMKSCS